MAGVEVGLAGGRIRIKPGGAPGVSCGLQWDEAGVADPAEAFRDFASDTEFARGPRGFAGLVASGAAGGHGAHAAPDAGRAGHCARIVATAAAYTLTAR